MEQPTPTEEHIKKAVDLLWWHCQPRERNKIINAYLDGDKAFADRKLIHDIASTLSEQALRDERLAKLSEENAKLKEALAVYADRMNWCSVDAAPFESDFWKATSDRQHGYELAQQALAYTTETPGDKTNG